MKTLFLILVGISLIYGQDVKENEVTVDSTENNLSSLKLYLVNGISIGYQKEINSEWAWQIKFDADFNCHSYDYDDIKQKIYNDSSLVNYEDKDKRYYNNEGQTF